eukprot:7772363-Lingulodinium_polyedra.AAC.1
MQPMTLLKWMRTGELRVAKERCFWTPACKASTARSATGAKRKRAAYFSKKGRSCNGRPAANMPICWAPTVPGQHS